MMFDVRFRVKGVLQGLETRHTVIGQYDYFAIDPPSRNIHLLDRRHQVWNLCAPVVAVSREHLDPRTFDPGQHPVAVKLDLVKPNHLRA